VTSTGAPSSDLHHRKRVECNRPSAVLFGNQGDDGAGKALALAGEDAVGQFIRRQRLGCDGTELRDQTVQLTLRQRPAGTLDDAGHVTGMSAQGKVDG
jgi:hypothetical protein